MGRLLVALIVALGSIVSYCTSTSENPVTGEKQHVALRPEQEIALGVRTAPEMAVRMGGLSRNERAAAPREPRRPRPGRDRQALSRRRAGGTYQVSS